VEKIEIGHGSGGRLTRELIEDLFLKYFASPELSLLGDASYLPGFERLAVTTDSYVVQPLFFPGGDIGKLSVSGTVNDLVVSGALPQFISVGFIIEEGFPMKDLERIVKSISQTAERCGVKIVAGDTKVVERGKCDGVYVNTTGIGRVVREFSPKLLKPGDVIIVTGFVGDHGTAISIARERFEIETGVVSDCAPLDSLLVPLFEVPGVKFMRDPTRGGLATVLVELSHSSGLGMRIYESKVPVREEVRFVCEMLGYDPFYLANEGKAVIVVSKEDAGAVLSKLKSHPLGKNAEVIGEVTDGGDVVLVTRVGGQRRLDLLEEDPLPRIC